MRTIGTLTPRGWHVVTVLLFAGLVLAMAWNPR